MAVSRRILLVGASGAFGERLARLLARWPDVELVLAARRTAPLDALAAELAGAGAKISVAAFDRRRPDSLAALAPWAVVDAAGPFQASDLTLPRAAIAAGAHYVDLADGRAFVAGFAAPLDAEAHAAGVLAVTGASSTPALANAALDVMTAGWASVSRVTVAISPGAQAPLGRAVVAAILSYVGRPVRVFAGGRWTSRPGWSGPRRLRIPGLGRRWASLCETPDLDVIPERFAPTEQALFLAGLELPVTHLGLWLLSWPVRLRLVRDLTPLAGPLRAGARLIAPLGSDRGGMVVLADGMGADGRPRAARWSLVAQANAGPSVPSAPAAALLRALKDGRLERRGAAVCAGLLPLAAIEAEIAHLPIATRLERATPNADGLFRRVLGEAFDALPPSVARVHGPAPPTLRGRAVARGSPGPAWLLRAALGLPQPGRYPLVSVEIAAAGQGETWTRAFGGRRFASRLRALDELGLFEEAFGPIRFTFEAQARPQGFVWRFAGWRLGPLPLPNRLAPKVRARAFEADGTYRFRVLAAYPVLGVLFAYAGRLE